MEDVSMEEVIDFLHSRIERLEAAYGELIESYNDLWLDHQALFRMMRNTGRFSKDMWTRLRREIADQTEEEDGFESADEAVPEGTNRG